MSRCKSKTRCSRTNKIVSKEELADHAQEVHSLIAKRAYQIYESRNRSDGRDLGDWRQAESEVLCNAAVGFMQSKDSLTIYAGVPGFAAEDLRVSIEPSLLTVSGKRNMTREEAAGAHTPGLLHLFRVIDLPEAVLPRVQNVRLSNGLLELSLPKVAKAREGNRAA